MMARVLAALAAAALLGTAAADVALLSNAATPSGTSVTLGVAGGVRTQRGIAFSTAQAWYITSLNAYLHITDGLSTVTTDLAIASGLPGGLLPSSTRLANASQSVGAPTNAFTVVPLRYSGNAGWRIGCDGAGSNNYTLALGTVDDQIEWAVSTSNATGTELVVYSNDLLSATPATPLTSSFAAVTTRLRYELRGNPTVCDAEVGFDPQPYPFCEKGTSTRFLWNYVGGASCTACGLCYVDLGDTGNQDTLSAVWRQVPATVQDFWCVCMEGGGGGGGGHQPPLYTHPAQTSPPASSSPLSPPTMYPPRAATRWAST